MTFENFESIYEGSSHVLCLIKCLYKRERERERECPSLKRKMGKKSGPNFIHFGSITHSCSKGSGKGHHSIMKIPFVGSFLWKWIASIIWLCSIIKLINEQTPNFTHYYNIRNHPIFKLIIINWICFMIFSSVRDSLKTKPQT